MADAHTTPVNPIEEMLYSGLILQGVPPEAIETIRELRRQRDEARAHLVENAARERDDRRAGTEPIPQRSRTNAP